MATKLFAPEAKIRVMSVLGGAGGSPHAAGIIAISHCAPVEGPTKTVSRWQGCVTQERTFVT